MSDKFVLMMKGVDQNGTIVTTSCVVYGNEKDIDNKACEITQSWIKKGIKKIEVVGVGQVIKSLDPSQN